MVRENDNDQSNCVFLKSKGEALNPKSSGPGVEVPNKVKYSGKQLLARLRYTFVVMLFPEFVASTSVFYILLFSSLF